MAMKTWNQTGFMSIGSTCLLVLFMLSGYILDNWELISYDENRLINISKNHSVNVTVQDGYYILTLNETITVDGQTYPKQVALIESIQGGMWKSCSVMDKEAHNAVASNPYIEWAEDRCVMHEPMGQTEYSFATGLYIRHMMTRTAQSCMIVSIICILVTVSLGISSIILKHAILSMVAASMCFSSFLYQIFAAALMMKRSAETQQHLMLQSIPMSLDSVIQVKYGETTYLTITSLALGVLSVVMWVINSNTLRGAIKLHVEETKYNLCCRT